MKVIIPVAGEGKRLRPFTFTKPKPLLPVAGKPMIDHIMDKILPLNPTEITFITGHLKELMEEHVLQYADRTKITCIEQKELNGTAGAVWLAKDSLDEDVLIDFGDTIFETDLNVIHDIDADGIIWALHVEDPSRFGVIVTDDDGIAKRIVEKPQEFVSNLANIGLYYVKNTKLLREGIEHTLKNKQEGKEAYLTDAFSYMIAKGARLKVVPCPGWFDCGTAEALLDANKTLLAKHHELSHEHNNVIIPPVKIHPTAKVENSIIGPYVSIGPHALVKQATISDCIVDKHAIVQDIVLKEMIVGEGMTMKGTHPVPDN
jgi:glucose-1-phosphate thymidylyltransferase